MNPQRHKLGMEPAKRGMVGIRMVTALFAGSILLALSSSPAEAWTYRTQGNPGAVEVPDTIGYCAYPCSYGGHFIVQFPARTVWRSTFYPSSPQVVKATFQLWRRTDGIWFPEQHRTTSVTIPPGSVGRLPFREIAPNYRWITATVTLEWRTLGGTFIGSTYVHYNAAADYTAYRPIYVAHDARVGAFLCWWVSGTGC